MYAVFSVEKDRIVKADEILKDNIVSRQSITVRDASALGIDNENRYILIEGNEDAIKRAEELFKGIEEKPAEEKTEDLMEVETKKEPEEGLPRASEKKVEEMPEKEIGKKLSEEEAAKIYDKIKKEEENAAEGVGFIFGE